MENKIIEGLNTIINELKNKEMIDENLIFDGYHTFDELYDYRMLYNAMLVNEIAKNKTFETYKSIRHSDGELCFGGGWFIVSIVLPTGIVDNHYKMEFWDLFKCEEVEKEPYPFDGHTPADVANRMRYFITK